MREMWVFLMEFWRRHDAVTSCVVAVQTLSGEIAKLVATSDKNNQAIWEAINSMRETLEAVKAKLQATNEKIDNVQGDVTWSKETIATLTAKVAELQEIIQNGDPAVVALVDEISVLATGIDERLTNVAAVIEQPAPETPEEEV